jgi:hypothetical protein
MVRKWNIPLTYQPKLAPVKRGECTQTIRIINKTKTHPEGVRKSVGDLIRFYTWMGKPYHSKRETITKYMKITEAIPIKIFPTGILFVGDAMVPDVIRWGDLDWLAAKDSIVPPTGTELYNVLTSKNGKIPQEGVEAQIIRWGK